MQFTVKAVAVQNTARFIEIKSENYWFALSQIEKDMAMENPKLFLLILDPGNEDRLSEFVWCVPLFLPVRYCRST